MIHTVLNHCRNSLVLALMLALTLPNLSYGFFGPDETPSAPSTGADFSESGYSVTTGPGSTGGSNSYGNTAYSEGQYQSSYGGPTTGAGSTNLDTAGGSTGVSGSSGGSSGYTGYEPDSNSQSTSNYDQGYTGQPGGSHIPSESTSNDSNTSNSSYFGDIPEDVARQSETYQTTKTISEASSYGVDVDTNETINRNLSGDIGDDEVVDSDGKIINIQDAKNAYEREIDTAENALRYGLESSNDRSLDSVDPITLTDHYTWTIPSVIDPGYEGLLRQAAGAGVAVDIEKTIAAHTAGEIGEREVIDGAGNVVNADEAAARYISAYNWAEWSSNNKDDSAAQVLATTDQEQAVLETVTKAIINSNDTNEWWDFLAEPPNPNTDETYVTLKARKGDLIEPGQSLVRSGNGYVVEGTGEVINLANPTSFNTTPTTPGLGIINGNNPLPEDQLDESAALLARVWIGETSPAAKLAVEQLLKGEPISEDALSILAAQALVIGNEAFIKNQTFTQNILNSGRVTSLEDGGVDARIGDFSSTQVTGLEELAEQILSGLRPDVADDLRDIAYATNWITPEANADRLLNGGWTIQTERGFAVLEGTGSIYDETLFGQSNLAVGTNSYGDYQYQSIGAVPVPQLRPQSSGQTTPQTTPGVTVSTDDLINWLAKDLPAESLTSELSNLIRGNSGSPQSAGQAVAGTAGSPTEDSEPGTEDEHFVNGLYTDSDGNPVVILSPRNILTDPYDFSDPEMNKALGIEFLDPTEFDAKLSPEEIESIRESVEQYRISQEFTQDFRDLPSTAEEFDARLRSQALINEAIDLTEGALTNKDTGGTTDNDLDDIIKSYENAQKAYESAEEAGDAVAVNAANGDIRSALDDLKQTPSDGSEDGTTALCDCTTVNITGRARPIDPNQSYIDFLNNRLSLLQDEYRNRGGVNVNIFSGKHPDPNYDAAKPDGIPSGRHAHGNGGDTTFTFSDSGDEIGDLETTDKLIETLAGAPGVNVGIGVSLKNGQYRITHVDTERDGIWSYPSGTTVPASLKATYDAARESAREKADAGITLESEVPTSYIAPTSYRPPAEEASRIVEEISKTAIDLPDGHPDKETAYETAYEAMALRDRIEDAADTPPAITGNDFVEDRLSELAALRDETVRLAGGKTEPERDSADGEPGGVRPPTTGTDGKPTTASPLSPITSVITGLGDKLTGLFTGGTKPTSPDSSDSSEDDSVIRSTTQNRPVNYGGNSQRASSSARFFSTDTLDNLFKNLTGQTNNNVSDTASNPQTYDSDEADDESATLETNYIPVTVTVNQVSGDITLTRKDLLDSIDEYVSEKGSLPEAIPLNLADPQNTSYQEKLRQTTNSNVVKIPPTIGGVRDSSVSEEYSYYEKEIEPLQAYALLASESVRPPLLLNDTGEIIYSNGVYAPPMKNGEEVYDSKDIPAYVYLIQYVNENGEVEVESNDDILPGNFFTNILNKIFSDNGSFNLNDVTSITRELIDPRPTVPRDEYYEYLIRLNNGSLRKVYIPQFSSVSLMREKFSEVGFNGNVLTLIGESQEIFSQRDNDKNIVNRALDIAGNALKQLTDIFKSEQSTEEQSTDLPGPSGDQAWSIENIDRVYVYPEADVDCPQVEGLYDGYVYKAVLKDHNRPNEAITITEARCGLGDPLTLINEIALNLQGVYQITPLPIEQLTEKTVFNSDTIDYQVGVTKSPVITVVADESSATTLENNDSSTPFIPNTTNTVAFAVKAISSSGETLVDWTTNDLAISGGTQLHFRWDGRDYNQCLPFLNDGGRYSLTRSFDQTMRTGNTESEGYDIAEASTAYRIECGGQDNGEFGVDQRVINVEVR